MSNKIFMKFEEFGLVKLSPLPDKIDSIINEFSVKNKVSLPNEYRYFLSNFGECNFSEDVAFKPLKKNPYTRDDNFQDIAFFYGLGTKNDINLLVQRYQNRIPKKYIPIADLPGGNQLCLNCNDNSDNYGKLYFWDHENEDGDNMYLIANSFENFIISFEKDSYISNASVVSSSFDF